MQWESPVKYWIALLALAGCAANPLASMDGYVAAALDAQLKTLRGQPLGTATEKLGYPSNKLVVGQDVVYIWSVDRMAQVYGTPVEFVCTVKVVTHAEQVIDVGLGTGAAAATALDWTEAARGLIRYYGESLAMFITLTPSGFWTARLPRSSATRLTWFFTKSSFW